MRILVASDAIWHPTGYGTQLKYLMTKLASDGHEVYNFCAGAFMAGYVEYAPGITVIGAAGNDDRWGNRSWNDVCDWVDPDVVITWLDCHGMQSYGWQAAPAYMWAPIDTAPINKDEVAILGRAAKLLCPSKWGQEILKEQGFESEYIPCAVDTKMFDINPEGRKTWRDQFVPPIDDDTFLIGMVGLNTGSPDRKGFGYGFDVIKRFVDDHPEQKVQAYIHTDPGGDGLAIPLIQLREALGLQDVIAFNPPMLPWGRPLEYMRDMYNAFDVYLHSAITEGFGVPIVEAQACGTPVVVNACTSVTELSTGAGAYRANYKMDSWVNTCTKVYLPDVLALSTMLDAAYEDWKAGKHDKVTIRSHVLRFGLEEVYNEFWKPLLETVPSKIDYAQAGGEVGPSVLLGAGNDRREGEWIYQDKSAHFDGINLVFDLNEFPWPVADNSWGYVEMSDVLEHLKGDLTEIMDELHRVMRPGGYVYIHTAEAGSWQMMKDPTHVQGFQTSSFNYYDPAFPEGEHYAYTDRKWKIVKRTMDAGGLVFVMQPRKEAVTFVEHFGVDVDGETVHIPEKCDTCRKENTNGRPETPEKEAVHATR